MITATITRFVSLYLTVLAVGFGQQSAIQPTLERQLQNQGLVNIKSLSPGILVDLKYSTTDNFLGEDTYGDLEDCYLQKEAAEKLAKAQTILQRKHPELTLLVYDGARPRSIQRKMWALVEGTDTQDYVANPERGSVHNFGSAVDLTVAKLDGTPLDMGTAFDYFGDLAQPRLEEKFLKSGQLTEEQIKNRLILRMAMTDAGFQSISVEWWHFNAVPVKVARSKYKIIE
jgi:D-alanyl-D-alanine dipeptidase